MRLGKIVTGRTGRQGKGVSAIFVVLGVTGHTGKVVAETLLARRQPVKVVVAIPADQGAAWRTKGAEVARPRWMMCRP
ncbi:MAG: hypothetical protein MRJ92_13225 [Nitrospira sp.]|nr:hypothetical protein [Nitrospira sp.]